MFPIHSLRLERITGPLRKPFYQPRADMNFWVLELPALCDLPGLLAKLEIALEHAYVDGDLWFK
jgi:hypothetical protein